MKKMTNKFSWTMMAILLLSVAWDDFPAMLAFYAVMTGYSILLGIGCLQSSGYAPVWEEQGIQGRRRNRRPEFWGYCIF